MQPVVIQRKRRDDNARCGRIVRSALLGISLCLPSLLAFAQDRAIQIAAGGYNSCAVYADGGVKCWGGTPRDVPGLTSGMQAVAIGGGHLCVLTTAGGVKCQGDNKYGQLGNGADLSRGNGGSSSTFVDVVGLSSGARSVATGVRHSCALMTNGAMLCWGANDRGQLGDGSKWDRSTPAPVAYLSGGAGQAETMAVGAVNSAAITREPRVMYWGANGEATSCSGSGFNAICVPVPASATTPIDAPSLPGGAIAVAIPTDYDAAGIANYFRICAVAAGGRVFCWGYPSYRTATEIPGFAPGVTAISMGADHACVLTSAGIVQCWGSNDRGQLGDGTTLTRAGPVSVVGLPADITSIAAGGRHTCALAASGQVWCWGANRSGQLGDGTQIDRSVPVLVGKPPVPNYQGLWWNAPAGSESGWGLSLAHQGEVIFATWYTYERTGQPWWLTMSAYQTAENTFSGTLYATTGPPFNAVPFNPNLVTRTVVGQGTLAFGDANNGTFAYTVNGVSRTKPITREVFGPMPVCVWGGRSELTGARNYQDLWWAWAGAESGWGLNLAHEGSIIFAIWFTYDLDGSPLWLSATTSSTDGWTFAGTLLRTTGPPFDAVAFDATRVTRTPVGTLALQFPQGNAGTFDYSVTLPGTAPVTQSKTITRQVFRAPGTACQ